VILVEWSGFGKVTLNGFFFLFIEEMNCCKKKKENKIVVEKKILRSVKKFVGKKKNGGK